MILYRKFSNIFRSLLYCNPLYRVILDSQPRPESFLLELTDRWPGNAEFGQLIAKKQLELFENQPSSISADRKSILSHDWLRDLRAVGTERAKRKALSLIEEWLASFDSWNEENWSPGVIGERLYNWICFFEFLPASTSSETTNKIIASAVRQWRHLIRCTNESLFGLEKIHAIKGIIVGGFALAQKEQALQKGIELLRHQLFSEILADGCHISRNPYIHLKILRNLIDIRFILGAGNSDIPHELATAIERMTPVLKFFRHGDGCLALFNGSGEGSSLEIDAVLSFSETKGRGIRRLPHGCYEKITAGRSLLLADVGIPPPSPHDKTAHAGLLSFEFSVGKERLIVNCGAEPENNQEWRKAMAATAAHSTITINDTNACDVIPDGGIGSRPKPVKAQRFEQDGDYYIEAEHYGYESKFRVYHRRSLCLSNNGSELYGREILSGQTGKNFALRWHLHPSVQASLSQGGLNALLRLPSGEGWRLKILEGGHHDGGLGIEPSIYGGTFPPRRSLQIKISGHTNSDPYIISWLLAREKK